MLTFHILQAVLQIFGMFAIGWLARRWGYIDERDINRWSHFIVDCLFPLLIFHSIASDFEANRLAELWPLPVIGFGLMVLGAVMGVPLRWGLKTRDPDVVRTFHHFCAINNYGFLPLIIVADLWGKAAVARLFFLNLGSSIGFWTIGIGLLGRASLRQAGRNLATPSLISLLLALGLSLSGLNSKIPSVFMHVTGSAGAAAIPCMLIMIGASLKSQGLRSHARDMAYLSLARLVILPVLSILILRVLPLSHDVFQLAVVVAIMPVSVSSTIITRRFGGSPIFAGNAAVVTTTASLATIPLALWLVFG